MKLRHPHVKAALQALEKHSDHPTRRDAEQARQVIFGRWEAGPMGGIRYVGEDDDQG